VGIAHRLHLRLALGELLRRRAEAGVDHDRGVHPLGVADGREEHLAAAEGVADVDRLAPALVESGGSRDRLGVLGEVGEAVGLAPVRCAHAGQRHRGHPEIGGEERGDEAPPVSVRRVAMHEQQAGLSDLAPGQDLELAAQAFHEHPLGFQGDGVLEPLRRGRFLAMILGQRRLHLWRQRGLGVHRTVVIGFRRFHGVSHRLRPQEIRRASNVGRPSI
jgi:hypothetical protein